MSSPRSIQPGDEEYFDSSSPARTITMRPPHDMQNCEPCEALLTTSTESGLTRMPIYRVPWTLDDEEIMTLRNGGTLWVSCWGGMPPLDVTVT